jgi:hypothetical protein
MLGEVSPKVNPDTLFSIHLFLSSVFLFLIIPHSMNGSILKWPSLSKLNLAPEEPFSLPDIPASESHHNIRYFPLSNFFFSPSTYNKMASALQAQVDVTIVLCEKP